ncbi:MAG: hypothetical protein V4858_17015 [Pseudomonadota bacterium]
MDAIKEIEAALAAGPSEERKWELWTSNSYRRMPGAIEPTIQHSDNHPDLHATIETLEYVVAVQPANIRKVLQLIAARDAEIEELKAALERTLSWMTSYPGGGPMGPNGPYEQARAALNPTQGAK